MRVKKSFYNVSATAVSYLAQTVMAFILRREFLSVFGLDYVGLEAVFANLLSLLSLAELGIGLAITYRLYKPLAEGDYQEVALLMGAYRRFYSVIAFVITGSGLALSLFLPYIIRDALIPTCKLYSCFYLYLFQTSATYLLAYKRSLLVADQDQYITVIVDLGFNIVQFAVRLLILYYTRNYVLYLVISLARAILVNVVISAICDKKYPFLTERSYSKVDIVSKMKDMSIDIRYIVLHKFADYVYSSTDGIVISAFLGIAKAGLLANYNLIVGVVSSLFHQCSAAIQSSMGNLVNLAREDLDKVHVLLDRLCYLYYSVLSFCAICLYCLLSPFVTLWIGENYVLSQAVVRVICINLYLYCYFLPIANLYTVKGLYKGDLVTSPVAAMINLIASVLAVRTYGLIGVYLGTTLGSLTYIIGQTLMVYHRYFHSTSVPYFRRLLKYFIVTCAECTLTVLAMSPLKNVSLYTFIVRALICLIVPNGLNILFFHNTSEYLYFMDVIKRFRKREI